MYNMTLPLSLFKIHNVFHVLLLRKYVFDPSHIIKLELIKILGDLTNEELIVQILNVINCWETPYYSIPKPWIIRVHEILSYASLDLSTTET